MSAAELTISEVLTELQDDFADLSVSKIRFLEREGLIRPARSPSGYRQFSQADVDRLRLILTAQRDHYLPLRVIRDELDRHDGDETPTLETLGLTPEPADESLQQPLELDRVAQLTESLDAALGGDELAAPSAEGRQARLSLDELCEASGLSHEDVAALREFGLVETGDGEHPYGADDLVVARACRQLFDLGLEARHLKLYRQLVDRQTALFRQVVTPMLHQRRPSTDEVHDVLGRLTTLSRHLEHALTRRVLRRWLDSA